MEITNEILEAGKSRNGGWSEKQIRALGVESVTTKWLNKGWKRKLIGADVPEKNIEKFLSLRDVHLRKGKGRKRLLDKERIEKMKLNESITAACANKFGTEKYNCRTCFHKRTGNCEGLSSLSKVCSYWYDPESEVIGFAYWDYEDVSQELQDKPSELFDGISERHKE